MNRPAGFVFAATFARSFLIQAAWSYHTMLGTGFAFALLPGLRRQHAGDPEALREAVGRHVDHFNAHPYLAGVALGAVLRLEAEGEEPETVSRFKKAVRGPLGGVGDRLVWARWLPLVVLCALVLHWVGGPWWMAVAGFIVVYNAGHLALRAWGVRAGLEAGRDVARRLADAGLAEHAARLSGPAALVTGLLCGALASGPLREAGDGGLWIGLGVAAFAIGLVGGHRVWRPAAATAVATVVGLLILGVLR